MKNAAFLRGMGAGAAAGAVIGAVMIAKRDSMRTGVGRAMKKAGAAMDNAFYDMQHMMR